MLGREVIWLQTFGDRFADAKQGRPAGAPRLPAKERPIVPSDGAIPSDPDAMPVEISYNPVARRLNVGAGHVDNVPPEVWNYKIANVPVVAHWFSYRGRDRARPIIGDRRPPSPLGEIQPSGWLAEYTTELLNVLNVLGRLVVLEPKQADLLARICAGPIIPAADLKIAMVTALPNRPPKKAKKPRNEKQAELLG